MSESLKLGEFVQFMNWMLQSSPEIADKPVYVQVGVIQKPLTETKNLEAYLLIGK